MDEVKIEYLVLSIYYVITDFKENYDEIFEQVINTPFSLYVTHIKVFFRIYFNKLRSVTDTFHYFSGRKKDYVRKKKRLTFLFLNLSF